MKKTSVHVSHPRLLLFPFSQLKDLAERFLQNDEWMYKLSLNAVAAAAAVKVSRQGSRMGSFAHVSGAGVAARVLSFSHSFV